MNTMKHSAFFLLLLGVFFIPLSISQETIPSQDHDSLTNPAQIQQALKQIEFHLSKKQNFEAYLILQDLETIVQKNNLGYPQVYLLLGVTLMSRELRDINKALEYFYLYKNKTLSSFSVDFNIAECHFISHDFEKSAQFFELLVETYKTKIYQTFLSIAYFKLYCCYLKLNQSEKARQLMNEKFSRFGDDPNFYLAHYIQFTLQQQYIEAEAWMNRAAYIYSVEELSVYIDIFEELNLYTPTTSK
jgi:tetratricopeptide (TPR) repeat protein